MTMIARHLEPNHHLEEYLMDDDADFIQTDNYCIFDEEGLKTCTNCLHCEEKTFMCSEDEYGEQIMTIIDELQNINEEIVDTTLDYSITKLTIKENEAKVFLYEDLTETVGKKPTLKDKEYYAFLKNIEHHKQLYRATTRLEKLKRDYEIKKLEAKMTGNFLNTIAVVFDE